MKHSGKKSLSLLLALIMVISLFGGMSLVGAEGEAPVSCYQAIDDFTPGQPALLVAEYEGTYYALTYSGGAIGAAEVTVSGDYASGALDDSALWKFTDQGLLESVGAPGMSLRGGSSFKVNTQGDRPGHYDAATKTYYVWDYNGTYYYPLTCDGTTFVLGGSSGSAIQLYTPVVYKAAADLDVGVPSILVAEVEGDAYALSFDGTAIGATKVTVAEDQILGVAPTAEIVWTFTAGGLLESAAFPGMSLRGGSSFKVNTQGDRPGHYDAATKTYYVWDYNGTYYYPLTCDGTTFTLGGSSGSAITVYSIPSAAEKYTITFVANLEGVDDLTGTKTQEVDYKITEELQKSDYAFEGWNTASDGSGTAYAVGDSISEDGDLTLYAIWTEVEAATYTLTDTLTEHNEYIVVAELEGAYYALTYDGHIGFTQVTVENDSVVSADLPERWILSEDNELESVAKAGTFLYPYSGGMTYSSGRKLVYDGESLSWPTSSGNGFMTFDGAKFGYVTTADDASRILLFTREVEWVEPPQQPPAVYPEPETITRAAVKNADGSITLAFTSDVHYDGENLNLKTWLEAADVGYIDAFGFCGDMGSAYASSANDFWTWTGAVMDYVDTLEEAGKVGNAIYTHGNHEWFPTAGGDYANEYRNYPAAQRLMQVGPGLVTDDYIIYCFGSGEVSATFKYDYNVYDVAEMAEYLASAPTDVPIFILTHFPIHEWYGRGEERYMKHANEVIDALNEAVRDGHDITVLWGHNHSDYDDNYYAPVYPGQEIVIDPKGNTRTLDFTYLAAGCTADAEYTGPSAGSAACMNKGLIVTLNADGSREYTYYTIDGQKMNVKSPWLVRFRDNQEYKVFYTPALVEDGDTLSMYDAAKAAPTIEGYDLVGWTTWEDGAEVEFDFDQPITRNQLVTAVYEEYIDESAGDMTVYVTVSMDGERKVTAEPLAIAPGSTYDDALAAIHSKYAASDSSIVYKASSNNDYNMYLIETMWGVDGTPYTILNGETLSETVDSVRLHEGDNLIIIGTSTTPVLSIGATIEGETATLEVLSWSLDIDTFTYSTEPYANAAVTTPEGETVGTTDENGCIEVSYPGTYIVEKSAIHVDKYEIVESASVEYTFDPNAEGLEPIIALKYKGEAFDFGSVEVPQRDGYDFVGWNTKRDGSGETFTGGDTVDINVKLSFYGVWEETVYDDESEETDETTEPGTAEIAGTAVEIAEEYKDQNVAVEVTDNADGSVTVEVTADGKAVELKNGVKVTLQTEAKPGQVVVVVNEDGSETILKKSVAENGEVTALLDGSATIKVVENAKKFDDVPENAWYGDAVAFVSSHDIYQGDENGNFNPKDTMTRAMMATVLYRLEDEPAAAGGRSFSDVAEGKWYTEAVKWASENGIMNGYGESFGINDPVTREQMAALIYNYFQALGLETELGSTESFPDAGEIHSWAADGMAWAVKVGLFQGDDQGKLNPGAPATRAEVAVLVQRLVKLLVK